MRRKVVLVLAVLLMGAYATHADDSAERDELSKLQDYVGDWRGVGQLRRGSTKGAWTETCNWAWKFTNAAPSLVFTTKDGKYFQSGELRSSGSAYSLTAIADKQTKVEYHGKVNEKGSLVLVAKNASTKQPARISIRQVADGKRMIVLFERQVAADRFVRLSEVGFTRKGSNFGKGTNYIECVVTGGVGTTAVTYKGKTYYVCCTGCRDYFNDDPEGAIAEYQERKAEEKKRQATD